MNARGGWGIYRVARKQITDHAEDRNGWMLTGKEIAFGIVLYLLVVLSVIRACGALEFDF
ncbi:hypothetical protein HYW67_04165 [Candidatus Parcubacteria bacterium]|nr:hypothetical protein [Candidatus Parcubacteria bacterium]